jgi:phosphotransferase system enzyme I (PtsI)
LVDAAAGEVVLDAEERTRVDVKAVVVAASNNPIIEVLGNAGSVADVKALNETAASGIGLFRTELLFLNRSSAPTLEEQTQVYAEVLRAAPAGKVVFRTLDVDSDKSLPFFTAAGSAENGQTDLRGWRLQRLAPQILPTQLSAIAAAAKQTNRKVSVMAPMLASASEANEFATLAKAAGIDDIGVMVETVELAQSIETLAGIVNFISIGTNDLSRYLFGVDRLASESAELLDAWQPKLLATMANIVAAAKRSEIAISVCGEAAADALLAVVLAGLGVDSVSMAGPAIAKATSLLGLVSHEQAREIATAALEGQDRTAARQLASAKLEK